MWLIAACVRVFEILMFQISCRRRMIFARFGGGGA